MRKVITNYWQEFYIKNNMCSLCGQSGIIDTTGMRSPGGTDCGKRNFCICPNGQAMRLQEGRKV